MSKGNYYHNRGQEDFPKGVYDPPNTDLAHEIFGYSKNDLEEIKNYKEGYNNAKKQGKG